MGKARKDGFSIIIFAYVSGEFVCCECGKKRKVRKIDRFLGSVRYFIPTTVGDGALDVPKNRNSKPTALKRQSACVAFCIPYSFAYLTFIYSQNFCLRYVNSQFYIVS